MPKRLTWLHLSDIHFLQTTSWKEAKARSSMLSYLKARFATGLSPPNIIFCTGDIAFGNLPTQPIAEQYEEAKGFFKELLSVCGKKGTPLASDRLFLVPGNHDVDRTKITEDNTSSLESMADECFKNIGKINERITNNSRDYQDAIRRLEQFNKFFKAICPHIDSAHTHYVHQLEINKIPLEIVGLNTAWCCSGKEKDRRLFVGGAAQVSNVSEDNRLRIGLMHHPLEFMNKAESRFFESRMGQTFHLLLHGHEHVYRKCEFNNHSIIGTGAVSTESDEEHGIIYGALDFESSKIDLHLFRYSFAHNGWAPHTIPVKAPTGVESSHYPIPTSLLSKRRASPDSGASGKAPSTRRSAVSKKEFEAPYSMLFSRPGRYSIHDDYEDLVEAGVTNLDAEHLRHLWHDCFSPHLVEELLGDPLALHIEIGDSRRLITHDNLDAYFLRNSVVPPEITATANLDPQDQRDRRISFNAFVKQVSDPAVDEEIPENAKAGGENRVCYLVGDAGIGKSLAVLKMIDQIRCNGPDHRGYTPIPVYFDLHVDRAWRQDDTQFALDETVRRSGRELLKRLPEVVRDSLTNIEREFDTAPDVDEVMRKLCQQLIRKKMFPFFVFDNADRFFFENAKYRFFPLYARRKAWFLEDTFLALVNRFVSEQELGKIGACVLFVCRKYVYNYCKQISDSADRHGPIRENHAAYQLYQLSPEKVVESRVSLMEEAIKKVEAQIPFKASLFRDQFSKLDSRLRGFSKAPSTSVLRTIWDLTHQGHRSLLDFLSKLPLDVGKEAQIAERLFDSPHNLLRLYISNMRKRYTQKSGHFPNLFLCDALVDPNPDFEQAHQTHVHSYWLKYLILQHALNQSDGTVHSESLFELFVDEYGYESHLVRLAVGSLSDPTSSTCLEISNRDKALLHAEVLKVSSRGRALVSIAQSRFGVPLCFSFDYLQLVTDDYLLALPKSKANAIYVDANLGHTLKAGPVYDAGARLTLAKKIPAVLTFLKVLKESFYAEMNYRGIRDSRLGSLEPDFDLIVKRTLEGLDAVLGHFNRGLGDGEAIDPRRIWERIEEGRDIRDFFFVYYGRPVEISI